MQAFLHARNRHGHVYVPSRRVAGLLAGVGAIACLLFGFGRPAHAIDAGTAGIPAPGVISVPVREPAEVVLYYEGTTHPSAGELAIRVMDPAGQETAVSDATEQRRAAGVHPSGRPSRRSVASFEAILPGTYQVTSTAVEPGGNLRADEAGHKAFATRAVGAIVMGLVVLGIATAIVLGKSMAATRRR